MEKAPSAFLSILISDISRGEKAILKKKNPSAPSALINTEQGPCWSLQSGTVSGTQVLFYSRIVKILRHLVCLWCMMNLTVSQFPPFFAQLHHAGNDVQGTLPSALRIYHTALKL